MALDEPKETDDVIEIDGFKYVVDKEFIKDAAPIKVDFKEIGFSITSSIELQPQSGCSSCGTSDTCG